MKAKPSRIIVTSQIGSTKTVYKSLMQRMIRFKFNLCMDIEEKPWSRCSNTFYSLFMYYCLTQPGKFSCAVDSFLELAFTILKDSLREINCNVFFWNYIGYMFTVRKLWWTDWYGFGSRTCLGLFERTPQLTCYSVRSCCI